MTKSSSNKTTLFLLLSVFFALFFIQNIFSQYNPADLIELYNQKLYFEAEQLGYTLLEQFPENKQVYLYLSLSLYRQSKFQKCIQYIKEGLNLFPQEIELLKLAGRVYIDTNNSSAATSFLEKALSINPQDAWSYYYYGRALFNLERYYDSTVSFEAAIRLQDDQYNFYYYLAYSYYKINDIPKAKEVLEIAMKRFNNAKLRELYQQLK